MISSQQDDSIDDDQERQENSKTNLIVNYLPQDMNQDELNSFFSTIGELESCRLIMDRVTSHNLGYGFVKYSRPEDAKKAVAILNGLRLHNKVIKVSYARPRSDTIKGANLYISGLPRNMTQQEFEALFSPYGSIITSRILCYKTFTHPNSKMISRGIGFLRFNQRTEAERAIRELHGRILQGSETPITVRFAKNNANNGHTILATAHFAPQITHRFSGAIHHSPGRFRYSPLTNSTYTANISDSSAWSIFVYNLSPEADEDILWKLFGPFGAVQNVKVVRDMTTNRCKGFGFVTMINYDEALLAIRSLSGYKFNDRILQVSFKT